MNKVMCRGFAASGIAAGIKKKDTKDLGLIYSEVPASVAGLFTRNQIKAAPVLLDMERVKSGHCQAIIINSGNANCCTGEEGMQAAQAMARYAADRLDIACEHVLVASTGVIGAPLPIDRIEAKIPELVKSLRADGFADLAQAMMTTDTVPKLAVSQGTIAEKSFSVIGVAKGAGMIRPDMATMLCFLCTDLKVSPQILDASLRKAVDRSLNRITIDGDTSTNDTVLILANGFSRIEVVSDTHTKMFQAALDEVLLHLAKELVRDGEGVTKLVEIIVQGAKSDEDAFQVVDTIAHSPLVKTALFGEDANWGRILAAVGRAGIPIATDAIDLFFDDVMMVKDGRGCGQAAETRVSEVLRKPEYSICVNLNIGSGRASLFTCDFSIDYVKINADYRS